MKFIITTFKLTAIVLMSLKSLYGMPTIDVPMQDAMQPASQEMTMPTLPPEIQASMPQVQAGMPTVTADGKVKSAGKKESKTDGASKEAPSIMQMKELKLVDEGLKGVGKVIDLFVGPFEEFGDAIPPTATSLFGPFAHIHWSLIIRSLQKRIKKAREDFASLTGAPKPVEVKPKKPEAPVDFMAAMQQQIEKKEPEQKKKLNLLKFMPKKVLQKIYDSALAFVKKVTHPLEKKSLAVAELFEPLPPIPFLVTVSDMQLALHILSLQQRLAVIEESLKNKLEPLEEVKKRVSKDAVKVADLDPMVAMAAAPEPTPEQKKKAEEDAKKKKEKKTETSSIKLKDTKQVGKVYAAFKSLDTMTSSFTKPIEKLTKDLPAMPVPLVSFLGAGLALTSIPTVFFFGIGIPQALVGASLYGVSQTQFAIYVRNLQQLLGKIEGDIKNYQEAKKTAATSAFDPNKVLAEGQMQMGQPDQNTVPQDDSGMPSADATPATEMPSAQAMPVAVDTDAGTQSVASESTLPPE